MAALHTIDYIVTTNPAPSWRRMICTTDSDGMCSAMCRPCRASRLCFSSDHDPGVEESQSGPGDGNVVSQRHMGHDCGCVWWSIPFAYTLMVWSVCIVGQRSCHNPGGILCPWAVKRTCIQVREQRCGDRNWNPPELTKKGDVESQE